MGVRPLWCGSPLIRTRSSTTGTAMSIPFWSVWQKRCLRMWRLKIPLISDEAINIGKSWLFEEELTELFHERPQAILPHGRDELIMQAALAEQRMDTSLGCAGL